MRGVRMRFPGSLSLKSKIAGACRVLDDALRRFPPETLACTFTGGKDSLVALHLLKEQAGGQVPCRVLRLDTSVKFPEILAFVEEMTARWELDMVVARNDAALSGGLRIAHDPTACCKALKVDALNQAIESYGIKGLITGVRADEHAQRSQETHFSARATPPHTRINPVLEFTEADIWNYIHQHELPYCTLYDQGYRSIGCMPCTKKVSDPKAPERTGRSLAKEEIMAKLRGLGYF